MPNQPSKHNVQRAIRVPWTLDMAVQKKFRTTDGMSIKDAYIVALIFATKDVKLSADDYDAIAELEHIAENTSKHKGRK